MTPLKNIIIIIQRSNGDVFYSGYLVQALKKSFPSSNIDLLINDDTFELGNMIQGVNSIIKFSYSKKSMKYILSIVKLIIHKYDLSINLTSSDRSVMFAALASKNSISCIEEDFRKSWWKKIILKNYFFYEEYTDILTQTMEPLSLLGISKPNIHFPLSTKEEASLSIKKIISKNSVKKFIVFHPSAQYKYKLYDLTNLNILLEKLCSLDFHIFITGGKSKLDLMVKNEIIKNEKIINLIGKISLDDFVFLSAQSIAYFGTDTLNTHIAIAQRKPIFAFFGPTILKKWLPRFNEFKCRDSEYIRYFENSNINIFQSNFDCVPCGLMGCNNNFGDSECLKMINPNSVFDFFYSWYVSRKI